MRGASGEGLWAPDRRLLTAGLVVTVTLIAAEALAVITVLPLVKDDLGGIRYYGWATSAFFLGTVMGVVVGGRDADRRGPVVAFVAGLVLFAAGLIVCGAANRMLVLVAGRAVQGVGAGAITAVAYVAIAAAYPDDLRPRVFAVLSTAWVVPGLIGPGLASLVGEHLGWRWVFVGLVPLVASSGLATLPAIREVARAHPPVPTDDDRFSALDAARVTAAAGLLLVAVSTRSVGAAPVAIGAAVIGWRPAARLLPPGDGHLAAAVVCGGLLTWAFFGADAFVPLTVTSVRHRTTAVASVIVTAATLSWTAGAWAQARQLAAWSRRRLIVVGLALILGGIAAVSSALVSAVPLAAAMAGWSVAGFGMGLAYSSVAVVVLAEAPPGRVGAATAAVQLVQNVGIALGTGAAGAAVAAGDAAGWRPAGGLSVAFAVTAAAAVLGFPFAARLRESPRTLPAR